MSQTAETTADVVLTTAGSMAVVVHRIPSPFYPGRVYVEWSDGSRGWAVIRLHL